MAIISGFLTKAKTSRRGKQICGWSEFFAYLWTTHLFRLAMIVAFAGSAWVAAIIRFITRSTPLALTSGLMLAVVLVVIVVRCFASRMGEKF